MFHLLALMTLQQRIHFTFFPPSRAKGLPSFKKVGSVVIYAAWNLCTVKLYKEWVQTQKYVVKYLLYKNRQFIRAVTYCVQ